MLLPDESLHSCLVCCERRSLRFHITLVMMGYLRQAHVSQETVIIVYAGPAYVTRMRRTCFLPYTSSAACCTV